MGGYITGKPTGKDPVLLDELRGIPLEALSKVKVYFEEHYPETFKVSLAVFEELFSDLLTKWEPLGKRLMGKEGKIDVYEAFAVMYTFCDGMFDAKIKELYRLFDFDGSGEIDFAELFLALQSTIYGFCKLLGLPIPSVTSVRALAVKAIKVIDSDENDYIDFEEFSDWVSNDEEIQDFLVENMQYQTRAHALHIYKNYYDKYIACFPNYIALKEQVGSPAHSLEESKMSSNKAPREVIKKNLMVAKDAWIDEETVDSILDIIDRSKTGKIEMSCYSDAIRAMCSFIATDLNEDHLIQPCELRTLLWLTEGVEPTRQRVHSEQKAMDIDLDGTISMLEWIKYLATVDPVSGAPYFDFSLKQKFDLYDVDNSGSISKEEIVLMLNDTLADCMGELSESMRIVLKNLLEDAAATIIKELDADGSEVLEWNEFKQSLQAFAQKTSSLLETIRMAKNTESF